MNGQPQTGVDRGQIVRRLLITVLFLPINGIVNATIVLTTLFQYVYLLITLQHSEPVRVFANKVISYGYRVWRFISLNENLRPFPFTEIPGEMELPEEEVTFP
ncbi:MAG: DUF4389 domain-containing protein [Syntrophales bacterium]|nr:DUF4389 domain-containing protein [Syntrophales bacterium]